MHKSHILNWLARERDHANIVDLLEQANLTQSRAKQIAATGLQSRMAESQEASGQQVYGTAGLLATFGISSTSNWNNKNNNNNEAQTACYKEPLSSRI